MLARLPARARLPLEAAESTLRRQIMKRILIISALIFSLCSSLAYGENPLLSKEFWETATVGGC
jgi:hypothetical protein